MTRKEILARQSLPDWMKEFERLSNTFFDKKQYTKPKTKTAKQKEKIHDIKYI